MRRLLVTGITMLWGLLSLAGGCASLPGPGGKLWPWGASAAPPAETSGQSPASMDSAWGEKTASAAAASATQRRPHPKPGDSTQSKSNPGIGQAECSDSPPSTQAKASTPSASGGPSTEELHALMQQLQQLAILDPEAQKLLMEDLSKTDPALWKPLMERFRVALEYHRRLQQSSSTKGGPTEGDPGLVRSQKKADETPSSGTSSASGDQGAVRPGSQEAEGTPSSDPPKTVSSEENRSSSSSASRTASGSEKDRSEEVSLVGYVRPMASGSEVRRLPPPTAESEACQGPMGAWTKVPAEGAASPVGAKPPGADSGTSPPPNKLPKPETPSPSAAETSSWQERLTLLLREMQRELSPTPQTDEEMARHVYYRLLCLAAGRREEALQPIPGAPPAMQDFWSHELYAIDLLLDGRRQTDRRLRTAEAKDLLDQAASKLAIAAPLLVRGLAFATEVQSFGCYGGLDKYEFQPGQEVLLYAEVENFQSQPTPKGFHTKLRSRYQIFNAEGHPVAEQEFPVTEEYCRQLRRDFFIAYPVVLPRDLQPGHYTLKLSLEDLHRGEMCQGTIDFSIRKTKS